MSKAKSREKEAEAHEETIVNDENEGGPLPISKLEVRFLHRLVCIFSRFLRGEPEGRTLLCPALLPRNCPGLSCLPRIMSVFFNSLNVVFQIPKFHL